jgi:hypothetical protein
MQGAGEKRRIEAGEGGGIWHEGETVLFGKWEVQQGGCVYRLQTNI